jgi:hypothetical protein
LDSDGVKVLTIRFINTRGLVSRLITGATFSYIDHVEAKNRSEDAWVGAHAFTGIEARPLDWADKDLIWVREYSIVLTDEEYEDAMALQEAAIGTKYNYWGVLGVFLHIRKLNNPKRKDCSEHIFELLLAASKQCLNVLDEFSWMITPETLHLSPIFIGRSAR